MGDNRLCNIFCKYLQILLHSVGPSRCCCRSSIFLVETTSLSSSCPPAVGWDDIQDRKGAEHEGTPVNYVCFIYLSTCCQETSQHQKSALTEAPFLLFSSYMCKSSFTNCCWIWSKIWVITLSKETWLRYESSTPPSQELSTCSPIFQILWVSQGSVTPDQISTLFNILRHTCPILTLCHQEFTSTILCWLSTTQYQPLLYQKGETAR